MRKLLLILTVLLAALPSRAQTDTLTLGYCKGQIAAKGRTTAQGKKWISGAIRLTSVTLSPFVDNKIVGVRVGLCSRVNIDTLQVWVRTTATGENLAGDHDFVKHGQGTVQDVEMAGGKGIEGSWKQGGLFHNCQLMGVLPSCRRMALVCEKWRQPKKAPRARGDGCGASRTW